ncbi:hypothetical protein TNCV_1087381 [Trichonephila clavipes]|nr:hypothetical protein TNCV_1087381 [Trichonephila clavipes]
MDVFKRIVPSQHGGALNSEEGAPDHSRGAPGSPTTLKIWVKPTGVTLQFTMMNLVFRDLAFDDQVALVTTNACFYCRSN